MYKLYSYLIVLVSLVLSPMLNAQCAPEFSGFTNLGQLEGHNYYLSDEPLKAVDASVQALSMGGYLAAIDSQEEDEFLSVFTSSAQDFILIGLNDADSEGDLVWSNGEVVSYVNIDPCGFCSSNDVDNDYVVKDSWTGAWSFINYWSERRYVVEISCGEANTDCSFIADFGGLYLPNVELSEVGGAYRARAVDAFDGNSNVVIKDIILSSTGQLVSSSEITSTFSVNYPEEIIASSNDDYYLILSKNNMTPRLVKRNFNGDVIWDKIYTVNLPWTAVSMYSTVHEDESGITITGEATKDAFIRQSFVIRLGLDGGLLWQSLSPGNSYKYLDHTNTGYYLSHFNGGNIAKLDNSGNTLWDHFIFYNPSSDFDMTSTFIGESSDGASVYFATHFGSQGEEILLTRLNSSTGELIWERDVEMLFGLPSTDLVSLIGQVTTMDNGLMIHIRWTEDFYSGPTGLKYGKVDQQGNLVWVYDTPKSAFSYSLVKNTSDNGFLFFNKGTFYQSNNPTRIWKYNVDGWNAPICGSSSGSGVLTINSCPGDVNQSLTSGSTEMIVDWAIPVASSSCFPNDILIEQVLGANPGTPFSAGTYPISYEATDQCGNTEVCSFSVTVSTTTTGGSCNVIDGFVKLGEYNGHGYYMSDGVDSWSGAKAVAEGAGGYLVTMNNQAENDYVKSNLGNEMVFIGYNDSQNEGAGQWANGEFVSLDLSYNNTSSNDFAVMNFWAGTWQMEQTGPWRKYIMEMECGSVSGPANLEFSFDCPSQYPIANEDFTVNLTVTNTGGETSIPTSHIFAQRYYQFGPTHVAVGSFDIPAVASNETIVLTKTFNDSEIKYPGLFYNLWHSSFGDFFLAENEFNYPVLAELDYFCKKYDTDLSINLSADSYTYGEDGAFEYQVTISNIGSVVAENVVARLGSIMYGRDALEYVLPSGVEDMFSTINDTEDIFVSIRSLSPGESKVINVSFTTQSVQDDIDIFVSVGSGHNTNTNFSDNQMTVNFTKGDVSGGTCDDVSGFVKIGELNGHGYYMSESSSSWDYAKALAENAGGYLVTMNSQAENDFVKANLGNEMVFIGYNDAQNEGTGQWANGESVSLDLSYNNTSSNDFAVMNFWAGTWQMEQAGPWRKYIMEMDCGGTSSGDQADLSVSNITNLPVSSQSGTQVDFNFDLNNTGNITASGSYVIGMYLSTDNMFSTDDVLVGEVPTGGTPVGTISNVPSAIAIPAGMTYGNYFLLIVADNGNVISESNESNNMASSPFIVTSVVGGGCADSVAGFSKLGELNGHAYYMSDASVNWNEAKVLAENAGGYLATMNTQAENDFLKSNLNNNMVFIGYNDAANEGVVQWANNETVAFDLGYENTSNNDYAVMNFWAGTWQMVNAMVNKRFVMEMNCESQLPVMRSIAMLDDRSSVEVVYPNPVLDILVVRVMARVEGDCVLDVYDSRGQIVKSVVKTLLQGMTEVEIDLSDQPVGMYLVKEKGSSRYHKIVIMR